MILLVCVKLNEIFDQGRNFNWIKPDSCPRCTSARVWGHGYVSAYFDGFAHGLLLRRFRCPDCNCIIRMKPKGYFRRFQAATDTIRCCINQRLLSGRWHFDISKSRQRHWFLALKQNAMVFFGPCKNLLSAFDRLIEMDRIPVSRSI